MIVEFALILFIWNEIQNPDVSASTSMTYTHQVTVKHIMYMIKLKDILKKVLNLKCDSWVCPGFFH